jgi:hypothetical protein
VEDQEPEASERRKGYEGWLDQIAGRRVATLPLFLAWAAIVCAVLAVAFATGNWDRYPLAFTVGPPSVLYWFVAVPTWLARRRSRQERDSVRT